MLARNSELERVVEDACRVVLGKQDVVRLALACMLARGHLLIEDLPGVGKTTLAHVLARLLGLHYQRIQFTSDLLPADIIGVAVFNRDEGTFQFHPGPVFSQLVLADEINRATPKTQSALLEAMEERQVTVDGQTYLMEAPFLVLATQNPIEYEGTFPLPEAQLDRFMLRIHLGYPDKASEVNILGAQQFAHPITGLAQVVSREELVEAQQAVKQVYVDDLVKTYIIELGTATREHPDVYLGASPRGSLALYRTGQALAAIRQRDYVIPDDIKYLTEATLAHRLIISPAARIKNVTATEVIEDILTSVPVPGARVSSRDGQHLTSQRNVLSS